MFPLLLFNIAGHILQALVKKDPIRRQVLRVKGCLAGSKAENLLEQGDMILAVDKEPVTCFIDIENACQALDKSGDNDGNLKLTIFRQVSKWISTCGLVFSPYCYISSSIVCAFVAFVGINDIFSFTVCQGREIDLIVGTDVRDGNGTTRVINWCGCIVQDSHPAVRALGFLPEEGHGVYVAR